MQVELSLPELELVQTMLGLLQGFSLIVNSSIGNKTADMQALEGKIKGLIGDPVQMMERREIEDGIRKVYVNDPEGLADMMIHLDQDFPLPKIYKQ